jgi:hypothetical protein
MRYKAVAEADADAIQFLLDRIGLDLRGQHLTGPNWFCVTVREPYSNDVVAVLACEFKSPFDAHFSAAIDDPAAITRPLLKGIFQALFTKARRITALVEPSDFHTEDIVKRLGFVYEGFSRLGFDGIRDALVYGMLPDDCKYLTSVRAARRNGGDPQWSASQNRPTPTTPHRPSNRLM